MTYSLVHPPCSYEFESLSKPELRSYRTWFESILPSRLDGLQRAVQATPGFESWIGDLTEESLDGLSKWFERRVHVRRRTVEELVAIRSRVALSGETPVNELTEEAFSIALDVGMYLGATMASCVDGLRWEQCLGSKKDADFGHVLLVGDGSVPFNPVSIAVTVAYRVARGGPAGLPDVLAHWKGMLSKGQGAH